MVTEQILELTSALPTHNQSGLMGRRRFFAMNTNMQLVTRDWEAVCLLAAAEEVFHAIEFRFSRFRPSSELSRLNSCTGREVAVSREMFHLLGLSLTFHRLSSGVFDPAILPSLEAAGYDRSFELVPKRSSHAAPPRTKPNIGSIRDLVMDGQQFTIQAPPGLRLDLGGITKGFAVDEAARALGPAADFLADAGGDIWASGDGPDGPGWLVALANPLREEEDLALIRLRNQALATSTTVRRRWQKGGRWFHHLIDARTGRPVENDVLSVSVIAPSTIEADVFAKVALILGIDEGEEFLRARGAQGLFVLCDGTYRVTDGWQGGGV
jgi:thiamine biosynthesis lipoprotein